MPALANRVGSIVLYPGEEVAHEVVVLAGLLNSCRNLNHLHLDRRYVSDIAPLLSGPLPHLQTIFLNGHQMPGLRAHGLAHLLAQMTGLRRVALLPRTLTPLEGPEALHLDLICTGRAWCAALPLLLSRRWTARSVEIIFSRDTWQCVDNANIDWSAIGPFPDVASLNLSMEDLRASGDESGPARALALISACSALRTLQLGASVAVLSAMLPAICSCCRGLRRLGLHTQDAIKQSEDGVTVPFAGLLVTAIATMYALRALDIDVHRNAHLLGDVVSFCRQRRVACKVR